MDVIPFVNIEGTTAIKRLVDPVNTGLNSVYYFYYHNLRSSGFHRHRMANVDNKVK